MSPTQSAMLTVSHGIFAMSLSEENCVTLKRSINAGTENSSVDSTTADEKITKEKSVVTKESKLKKMLGKRRHSSTPDELVRRTPVRPTPRQAKSLTEIEVDTEIIDGLFTTTLCSTEL